MCATRFIPARISTTVLPSNDSCRQWPIIHVPTSSMIRATSCCNGSTIFNSSTSITREFALFTSRTPSFGPTAAAACTAAIRTGSTAQGRFRSVGDGQVDFTQIFSKLAQYDFPGWAVLEWECCLKNPEDGAREGASFIRDHIIRVTEKAFDDFAATKTDLDLNRQLLGLQ
jgi:hypothetical protein